MLFVLIEDTTSAIELLVFPRVLEKTQTLWEEGRVVLASGRTSWKGGDPKFICDDVKRV